MESWNGAPDSQFDEDFAAGFVGKSILVGITTTSNEGAVISQTQLHGVISSASAEGIDVALQGLNSGSTWRMPPCLADLSPARPGIYKLKASGETVEDPDFTYSVTVQKPTHQ
jgi:hypothetical protein